MAEDKAQLTPSLSTEDKLLQSICKVGSPSELLNLGDWRGWKSYAHQVIFESDQNFYKIYERGGSEFGEFYSVIRNNLADIYRELGISWEVMTVLRDGVITDVEKRQRLKVLTREDMSFKDALASFSVILEELEKRLEFQDILNQLKQFPEVSNVERLKLMRLCVNKYEDYAIFNDQVVLLDDTDWCIALVDHEGEPVSIDCKFNQTVYTTYGNFVFVNHFKNVRMEADAVIWHEKSPTMYRDKWWILRALDFNNSSTELKRDLSIIEADSHYSDRVLMDGLERKLRENIALMRLDEASKSQEDHFLYDEYEVGERTVMVYKLPLDAQGMRTVAQWNLSCDTCVNLADRSSTFENASTRPLYEDLLNLRDELDRFDDFGCDTISFKGNFFEGVLEPKLVKRAFYDVLRSCHELRKTGKLKRLCIEVSLKKGAQTDLYKALDFLETLGFDSLNNENGNGLWLCTHWNPKPFISEREMKNWIFLLKHIYNYYPWLR